MKFIKMNADDKYQHADRERRHHNRYNRTHRFSHKIIILNIQFSMLNFQVIETLKSIFINEKLN
jgi:hypothetical protein